MWKHFLCCCSLMVTRSKASWQLSQKPQLVNLHKDYDLKFHHVKYLPSYVFVQLTIHQSFNILIHQKTLRLPSFRRLKKRIAQRIAATCNFSSTQNFKYRYSICPRHMERDICLLLANIHKYRACLLAQKSAHFIMLFSDLYFLLCIYAEPIYINGIASDVWEVST